MNKKYVTASLAVLPLISIGAKKEVRTSMAKSKPNIIYILADDLGYGDLGCYDQQKTETPNIDKLAKDGMLFTNHYSGAPVSAPSRCVLLTGLHTGHCYIRGNDELPERGNVNSLQAMVNDPGLEGQRPLPEGTVTFPALLQKAGYTTACIGKWGLGYPGSTGEPNKMGFNYFYGYNCQRIAHSYYPPFLYRNTERVYLNNKVVETNERLDQGADPLALSSYEKFNQKEYAPDLMFNEITSFVEKNSAKPFMLFWTTSIPHASLQAPQRWIDHYVKKFGDEKPYPGSGYFPCRYPKATYAAMISYFDEQVGALIAQLKDLGIYNNTVIVFTSDNGPSEEGGAQPEWFDSASPFKSSYGWGKGSLHEGGIRMPFIVSWPSKVKAGSKSDMLCAFWDMLPTFCEMAGAKQVKTDGISLVPLLTGKKQKQHEYLYWEFPQGAGEKAIRMDKWKGLIRQIKKGNTKMALYDLEADPREQVDVADKYPDIIVKLRAKMQEAHTPSEVKAFNM